MTAVASRGVTLEEFLAMRDPDHRMELVNGEVIRMVPSKGRHGHICVRFGHFLFAYVDDHNLGWVYGNDAGVVIEGERDSLRGVDVGFWSLERNPVEPEGYFDNPPDLAVEVVSSTDRRKDVLFKVRQYLEAGVRLVWVADPESETVTVYSGSMNGVEHHEGDTLIGGEVLPGFARPVADFF